MYVLDNEIYRCFTVTMSFDKVVSDEEFDQIVNQVPVLLENKGIAQKVNKCLKIKASTILDDDDNEMSTTITFILDAVNSISPARLRRSDIEVTLQKEYQGVNVSVLVD